ncbi:MAG: xanthine dehydrogenase family protein molybdopterin-binding subunit [Burkholderiales bacterium]
MNAPQVQFDPESARFGASRSQKRLEDDRLLVGRGQFSDDRRFEREAALVVARSPHAHARIRSVNLDAARAAPGVLAVWTMAELAADGVRHLPTPPLFKRADGQPMSVPPRTPLAQDRALYVGHPVVAVVALTRAQAQDAADLAEIDYEDLPCVVDARDAVAPGAPLVWDGAPGNIAAETRYGRADAAAAAFKRAAHVTEIELHNQRLIAMAMEPRCAIAVHEAGRTTVYTQSQQPTGARDLLAAAFGAKPAEFRVVNGDIGGGFGMKTGAIPEEVLVAYAARKLGRPVRWRGDRSEEFLAAHMGRDMRFKAALALDGEGKFLALRLHSLGNMGAVPVGSSAMIPLMMVAKVVTSVYRVPEVDFHFQGVLTNTMATGAYRGAGRPEGNYLMERLVEKAAREMKIDPAEMRRLNLLQPGDFPYTTHAGEVYDAGDFPRMLSGVMRLADWSGYAARAADSRSRGRLRGRGLAMYLEWTGALPTETVDIEVDADGRVTVYSGTQAMGQGLETSYVQLVTEVLQVPAASVTLVQGDTDRANGVGSVGSRSAFVGGSAVVAAGRVLIVRARELAADALEAAGADLEFRNGRVFIAGTDRSASLGELAARQAERRLRVSATQTPSSPSWPHGAQACDVEVDPETGEVMLARMTSMDDIGRIINHMIVEGQIQGGMAQGAGQALYEQAVYEHASGQLLTGSLMDYCVPRADQFPPMVNGFDESVPCTTNLLGVKGCGEIGTIGAVPAVMHAVLDALAPFGVLELDMPLTPERVWRAMRRE